MIGLNTKANLETSIIYLCCNVIFEANIFWFPKSSLPWPELNVLRCCHHNIYFVSQALVVPEKFQHILRVLNTNIDGKQKIMFALTAIKVSRKDSYLQCISFTIRIMLLEWKPSFENFWFWFEVRKMVCMSCWCQVWCVRVQLNLY